MNEENIWMEGDIESINPDDFLNLDEFLPKKIKTEPEFMKNVCGMENSMFTQLSPQQLTPPISPQPIFIDSGGFQKVELIPVRLLKQEMPTREVKKTPPKIIPKPSSSSDSDSTTTTIVIRSSTSPVDKALIKHQRLIRNRAAALVSREKKKLRFETLEAENQKLMKENSFLKAENFRLKERLKSYSALTCRCASKISAKLPSKNATVLLALVFMVGFNVIPVKNLLFNNGFKEPQIAVQPHSARRLLSIRNSSISNITSSEESSEPETTYFNQTDHIRKLNIDNIRRWIPEPDLFNISSLKKDFEFNPDPLQEKLAKMYEKSREQSQKNLKAKKRSQKKKPMVGPMQLYDSNLNIIKLHEFFDEINRKDDTFYVFSFNADHLLLPAIDSNYKFSQIKMNLIMPRSNGESVTRKAWQLSRKVIKIYVVETNIKNSFLDSSTSDKITMMQIETIIVNTSLIQITEKSIPENFLKSQAANSTTSCNESIAASRRGEQSFNRTSGPDVFQGPEMPLRTSKLPYHLNSLDMLRANSKK